MFKKYKSTKGITLVALVITIIILLILAGITISQLTGSGLFEKAQLAEQESKNAEEKEQIILDDYENEITEYLSGTTRNDGTETSKTKEIVCVAQYNNMLTGYMADFNSGTFFNANNETVTGKTMKFEWTGSAYIITAMVDGKYLHAWNYDSTIIECKKGDIIYTFNRQSDCKFNTIGFIEE